MSVAEENMEPILWEGFIEEIFNEDGETKFRVHFSGREETLVVGASDLQPSLSLKEVQLIEQRKVEANGLVKGTAATSGEKFESDEVQDSGSVETKEVLKRKSVTFGTKWARGEVPDSGYDSSSEKVVPEFTELRRSSRKIQPTSKLLEGLETTSVPCRPASADGKGTKAPRGRKSSRGFLPLVLVTWLWLLSRRVNQISGRRSCLLLLFARGSPGGERTVFSCTLKPDKEEVVKFQLSSIHPEVLLFLSKIRQLSVREDNKGSSLNTVTAISISRETDFVTRKNVGAESYTLHISAKEDCDDREKDCSYYMWRQKFSIAQANRVERRMEIDDLVITLAFPNGKRLSRGMNSPGIYAFLPTDSVTNFPFIVQADFVLASSRETILWDNKWNQGILHCVPSTFVNAFISLVKTSGAALVSSLPRLFKFIPVDSSLYPTLNTVRSLINDKLLSENIMPSESYTNQIFFYKPGEVGRIMPAFWDILAKAKEQGVSLHNLSSYGMYALNSAFDREYCDDILEFLGVRFMDSEWYAMCIQSSSLVFGLSEDVYLELLFFVADNWWSHFQSTNMKKIPLLKYVGQDGYLYTCSTLKIIDYLLCHSVLYILLK